MKIIGTYNHQQASGADALRWSRDAVAASVREADAEGAHVLYEGLLVADVARTLAFHAEGRKLLIIYIDESIETCLASIRDRRIKRGDDRPLSTLKTEAKFKEILSQLKKFEAAGLDVSRLNRQDALRATFEAVGL